jgi:hypothetical protein
VVERGWLPAAAERRYAGTLAYRAPETLHLELRDRTRYPAGAWVRNDVELVIDEDRAWTRGPSGRPSLLSEQQVLLAWTAGGLPPGFAEAVAALPLLDRLTVVRGDPVGMVASWDADGRAVDRTAAGFRIPLDTIAVDTATYPALLPQADRSAFARLGPDDALLGETSAASAGWGRARRSSWPAACVSSWPASCRTAWSGPRNSSCRSPAPTGPA